VKAEEAVEGDVKAEMKEEPNYGEFTHETPEHDDADHTEHSTEMDEFNGFHHPLDAMDLEAFPTVTSGAEQHGGQWDNIRNLVGDVREDQKPILAEVTGGPAEEPASTATPAIDHAMETEDTSFAPTMAEAVAGTTQDIPAATVPTAGDEGDVREVAAAAEGSLAVPPALGVTPTDLSPYAAPTEVEISGIPTEEVNELPPADMPPVIDEVPTSTVDQVEAEEQSPVMIGQVETTDEPMEAESSVQAHVAGDGVVAGPAEIAPAEQSVESATIPGAYAPTQPKETPSQPTGPLETDAVAGETEPEAYMDEPVIVPGSAPAPAPAPVEENLAATTASAPEPIEEHATAAPATANGRDDLPLENGETLMMNGDGPVIDGV